MAKKCNHFLGIINYGWGEYSLVYIKNSNDCFNDEDSKTDWFKFCPYCGIELDDIIKDVIKQRDLRYQLWLKK
jgi:hypothetical protein